MDAVLLRRPNGRPQACDPCRARKVACDHQQPVCKRCRKRGQNDECVYTETAAKSRPTRRATRQSPATGASVQPAGSASVSFESLGPSSPGLATSPPSRSAYGPGYLGFTSHSTIFEETRHSLSLLHGLDSRQAEINATSSGAELGFRFSDLPPTTRAACLHVLQHLPGQPNELIVFNDTGAAPYEPEGWSHVAVSQIVRSLDVTFGARLKQGDAHLEQIAEEICNNTARPFRDIHTSPQDWLDQFCSPGNLRWESLGLVWAYVERISDALDALRTGHLAWLPGKKSPEMALRCLSYCLDTSRRLNKGNDLLLDLCRRKSTLESVVLGDASPFPWASHALTISLLTFMGLHVQPDTQPYKPSLCSENKRRLFAQIFNTDKLIVSFTGRPPLLSRRYCSTPLPLDLPDESLAADEETLTRAVNSLDHRGWNTVGGLYPATLARARFMMMVILDELTEISLDRTRSVTVDDLRNLKARDLNILSEFPSSLVFDSENIIDPNIPLEFVYARIMIHLNHLLNLFLVERLLLRNGVPDEGNLLLTSFDMVRHTLVLWTHKDQFITMRRNFEWLLMAFGAPGGGILCQELLRPSFTGTHSLDPRVSRSSITQQLSLLVGFLDWVRPSAPNADLCADCKTVIQRVLDHHLNAPRNSDGDLQALDWDFSSPLDFNFELLDTFDWIRADADWTPTY